MKRAAEGNHRAGQDAGERAHKWQPGHDLLKGQSLMKQTRLSSQSGLRVMNALSHSCIQEELRVLHTCGYSKQDQEDQ